MTNVDMIEPLDKQLTELAGRLRQRMQMQWSCLDRDGDVHQMVEREDLEEAIYAVALFVSCRRLKRGDAA